MGFHLIYTKIHVLRTSVWWLKWEHPKKKRNYHVAVGWRPIITMDLMVHIRTYPLNDSILRWRHYLKWQQEKQSVHPHPHLLLLNLLLPNPLLLNLLLIMTMMLISITRKWTDLMNLIIPKLVIQRIFTGT